MITGYEIPVGPARERLIQTIEYRDEYRGGQPAAVTYTWRGEYVYGGGWTFHPIQKYRAQDGCGGGRPNPRNVPKGHADAVKSECMGEYRIVHTNSPIYCSFCDGKLAD